MNYGNSYTSAGYGYSPQNNVNYPYASPQQRLQTMEQQYPQYGQTIAQSPMQAPMQAPQQNNIQAQNSIMAVKNEQQAREYPLDLSGAPQIFIMEGDSKIFAKRFNVSNGLAEFEVYEKALKSAETSQAPMPSADNSFLLEIVGNFSAKLENMYAEIQALRKEVQYNNGNQSNVNSKPASKQKSANATDNEPGAGNGAGGK